MAAEDLERLLDVDFFAGVDFFAVLDFLAGADFLVVPLELLLELDFLAGLDFLVEPLEPLLELPDPLDPPDPLDRLDLDRLELDFLAGLDFFFEPLDPLEPLDEPDFLRGLLRDDAFSAESELPLLPELLPPLELPSPSGAPMSPNFWVTASTREAAVARASSLAAPVSRWATSGLPSPILLAIAFGSGASFLPASRPATVTASLSFLVRPSR